MFWDNGSDFLRVLIVAPLAYAALVVFLRVSGKRMLSKLSAFDLVVTIALGSVLATILLSKDVALAEGLAALGMLLAMQFLVASLTARSAAARRLFKSEPTLLFFNGEFLGNALRAENISEEAVRAGIRQHGFARLSDVHAVVLETDGSFSILRPPDSPGTSTLAGVRHAPADGDRR